MTINKQKSVDEFHENITSIFRDRDALSVDPSFLIGKKVNEYTLDFKIGEGASSFVFEASSSNSLINKTVAIKVLKPDLVKYFHKDYFIKEGNILSSMNHHNIAGIYDVAYLNVDGFELPCIIMELVQGYNLDEHFLHDDYKLKDVIDCFISVANGLHSAHSGFIPLIHADIKPENIVVSYIKKEPKILDFGVSRALSADDDEQFNHKKVLLTPYSAPEMIDDIKPSVTMDIYAIGIILYEVLTKQKHEIGKELVFDNITLYDDGTYKYWFKDIIYIIKKATHPDPLERYSSIRQFNEDLTSFSHMRPLPSKDTSLFQVLLQKHKKKPLLSFFVGLAAISNILLITLGFYYYQQYTEQTGLVQLQGKVLKIESSHNKTRNLVHNNEEQFLKNKIDTLLDGYLSSPDYAKQELKWLIELASQKSFFTMAIDTYNKLKEIEPSVEGDFSLRTKLIQAFKKTNNHAEVEESVNFVIGAFLTGSITGQTHHEKNILIESVLDILYNNYMSTLYKIEQVSGIDESGIVFINALLYEIKDNHLNYLSDDYQGLLYYLISREHFYAKGVDSLNPTAGNTQEHIEENFISHLNEALYFSELSLKKSPPQSFHHYIFKVHKARTLHELGRLDEALLLARDIESNVGLHYAAKTDQYLIVQRQLSSVYRFNDLDAAVRTSERSADEDGQEVFLKFINDTMKGRALLYAGDFKSARKTIRDMMDFFEKNKYRADVLNNYIIHHYYGFLITYLEFDGFKQTTFNLELAKEVMICINLMQDRFDGFLGEYDVAVAKLYDAHFSENTEKVMEQYKKVMSLYHNDFTGFYTDNRYRVYLNVALILSFHGDTETSKEFASHASEKLSYSNTELNKSPEVMLTMLQLIELLGEDSPESVQKREIASRIYDAHREYYENTPNEYSQYF